MSEGAFNIRPYRPEDREAIRRICFLTGYMGDPVDFLWSDLESFSDMICNYYTDREPESILVAEKDGEVLGYLTGCVDSRCSEAATAEYTRGFIRRGALLKPGIAGFLWRSIFDVIRDRHVPSGVLLDERWPAHLHIDLLPEARGKGVGGRLMQTWLARLRELGSPGLHLGTFAENENAQAFFAAQGFARHDEARVVPGFRTREGARMHAQWFVMSLGDPA